MYNNLSVQIADIRQEERFEEARDNRAASEAKSQRSGRLALPSVDLRALGAQVVQQGKGVWWVPAGVAVLMLLYAIIGA